MRAAPVLLLALFAGCDHEGTAAVRADIVQGTETTAHPAVGALVVRRSRCGERPAEALCTVTLIAPDVVLTAGHCVDAYRDRQLEVLFGAGLSDPAAQYRVVVGWTMHPRYDETTSDNDLALLLLSAPVDLSPMTIREEPLDETWVGRRVRLVGFGESESGSGAKREGTAVIENVDALTFRYGPGPSMTCRGDSGGPALTDDGLAQLVGVTSAGDVECMRWGIDVRLDVHRADFIEPAQMGLPRPTAPVLEASSLCDAGCTADEDCPSSLACRSDENGRSLCAPSSGDPGNFGPSCTSDAECGLGVCAPFDDACSCYAPCAMLPPPPPPAPPIEKRDGGCRIAHGRGALLEWTFVLLALGAIARRVRRRGPT